MNNEKAIQILDDAINGIPNSCISEHISQLVEVRDYLRATALDFVADAPRPPPPPAPKILKSYYVDIELSDNFLAENEDDAWDRALDKISTRKGMQIVRHKIGEFT